MPQVAHYPLHEDTGGTAYDLVGGNDGTVNGATQGANGILGNTAYSFDGTDDYVDVDGLASLFDGASQMSVSVWTTAASIGSEFPKVFAYGIDGNYDEAFAIQVDESNSLWKFQMYNDSQTTGTEISMGSVTTGTWTHLVAVFDSVATNDMKGYTNGTLQNEADSGFSAVDSQPNCTIGAIKDSSGYAKFHEGDITEVRVYDHALSPSEVQYLYDVGTRGEYLSDWKQA